MQPSPYDLISQMQFNDAPCICKLEKPQFATFSSKKIINMSFTSFHTFSHVWNSLFTLTITLFHNWGGQNPCSIIKLQFFSFQSISSKQYFQIVLSNSLPAYILRGISRATLPVFCCQVAKLHSSVQSTFGPEDRLNFL